MGLIQRLGAAACLQVVYLCSCWYENQAGAHAQVASGPNYEA
jgi:hypothetical protein